jgi:hypothetical protein
MAIAKLLTAGQPNTSAAKPAGSSWRVWQLNYERCKRIVGEARLAHEQLGDMLARPSGLLRASLPVDFANVYLAPLIAEFAR